MSRRSVLEAIRQGVWDYEPGSAERGEFPATVAMPGTPEKIGVLAERLSQGLPLWHPEDCQEYEDPADVKLALLS